MISRRSLLRGISTSLVGTAFSQSSFLPVSAAKAAEPAAGTFTFEILARRMRAAAAAPYRPPTVDMPAPLKSLTYDGYKAIAFRPDHALWSDTQSLFRLEAFHMGWLFGAPVLLFEVNDGEARPIRFTSDDFEYRAPVLNADDFKGVDMPGVAGFRLHFPLNRPDVFDELIVFQGASYFRALGRSSNYGISARGVAIDTASTKDEEFPVFTEFYIERPKPGAPSITLYAALDGPSVTGAFAFHVVPGQDTIIDVTARLFFRKDIERLGIAPLNSMFLFDESNKYTIDDYRTQVHDSDGLQIVRKGGDQVWRALANPSRLANSIFAADDLSSFALLQRHRAYADYEDAEAHYERRPSLLVEPLNEWGKGTIQLVEIPSSLEQNDNIVAFWTPDHPVTAGQSLELAYRLKWGDLASESCPLACVIATRTGVGGPSGIKNEAGLRKFVVDFAGSILDNLPSDAQVTAATSVQGGEVVGSFVARVDAEKCWRVGFDVRPNGADPIEMSTYLGLAGRPLSETWHFQWRVGDEKMHV
jgi:periplasmic glucans biosynthesis protein